MSKANLSRVVIERTLSRIIITVYSARPGMVIGKAGTELESIRKELSRITHKEVQVSILEVKPLELDAKLVSSLIAQQVQARVGYKRVVKQAVASSMRMGAQGIKVAVSGRLGGAEIARTETFQEGRMPLQTLRADIDYAISEAQTVYGKIGIKVWIFKSEVYQKNKLALSPQQVNPPSKIGSKLPRQGSFKRIKA